MAMMIVKFHKLIQSKMVWYIVLGVIVIAFVGFFTPTMGGKSSQSSKAQPAGELFGKEVSEAEYRHAFQNTYLWYILSSGRMPEMTSEFNEALRQQAWQQLAMLRKAEEEKIIVADDEVIQQIQRMPIFLNQSGVFDRNAYRGILNNLGVSPQQIEGLMREQIAMYKLTVRPVQAALVSPTELTKAYHLYTDRLVLEYALLSRETVAKDVSVTREEAQVYFAENKEEFRIPPRVLVSYIEFPVSNFVEQVELPDGAELEYYNNNIEAYQIETTNELELAEYKPFEEVEAEISERLKMAVARRLATEEAAAVVADIAPKSPNEKPDFRGVVADAGLTVKTLPAFGPADELDGIDPTAPFKQAAFGLRDDSYSSFSDAVTGKDSVYVLSLNKRNESFLPDFDAVEEAATASARIQAVSEALAERALEIQSAVSEAMAAGSSFDDAIEPFGLSVEKTEEFDLSTELDNQYADDLIPVCVNVAQGDLCRPAPVEDGVLISTVAQRTSLDAEIGLPAVREELISGLSGARAQRLAADWEAALMDDANLKLRGEE